MDAEMTGAAPCHGAPALPGHAEAARDLQFLLQEVLRLPESPLPGHAELDAATTGAMLEAAAALADTLLAPLALNGDRQGCRLADGVVQTPDGFVEAFAQMRDEGWTAVDVDPAFGGQGLPYVMHTATAEMFVSANMAFQMYQGLTHGAVSAILAHGSDAQKALYVPPLAACRWTGTMNLTEPQAGSDLSLLRTRAEPAEDDSWRISGQKIFISAGEHDLAENIIHLVLARTPGAPAGTRGLSLFIVPKRLPDAAGRPGARNALRCSRLEEKMGLHGNATCVMDYDGATGWLLGPLHGGMKAMFTMMNEARLGVGLQGYACAAAAQRLAADYARSRLQGQAPGGGSLPLIAHPDIRRTLARGRAFVEGARGLTLLGAALIDRARQGDAAAEAQVSLLTPVIKAFLTDRGFEVAVAAQQVWGGHGYIEENGLSRLVRDARITMIYEGANGIQALDLVGRKLALDGGQALMTWLAETRALAAGLPAPLAASYGLPLATAAGHLQQAAIHLATLAPGNPQAALLGATDMLQLFGQVAIGAAWARMAAAAQRALEAGRGDAAFLRGKITTGEVWMRHDLPATALHLARITAPPDCMVALTPEAF